MIQNSWEHLHHIVSHCQKCQLGQDRRRPTLGSGNKNGEILMVLESPDEVNPNTGDFLMGAGGQLLDGFLSIVSLSRVSEVYVTAMVKCNPKRPPLATERVCCMDYLRQQVRLIQPKIIVCLGEVVAKGLIDGEFDLRVEHGTFVEKAGFQMMGCYAPRDLLHNPRLKPVMLEDMKKLADKKAELEQ